MRMFKDLFVLVIFTFSLGYSKEQGLTNDFDNVRKDITIVGQVEEFDFVKRDNEVLCKQTSVQGAISQEMFLNELIYPNSSLILKFNKTTSQIEPITDNSEMFPEKVNNAIMKAPKWLRNDLKIVFGHLNDLNKQVWADAILDANSPYIDEICFCIAHSSPQYLMSEYSSPRLFKENAETIYAIDDDLKYVEIIDYGDYGSDENYYSTTSYKRIDVKVDATKVLDYEIPHEIYYWYIVHPKITDEIPAFIKPGIQEDNYSHSNNISERGVFWRDFFYFNNDDYFPTMKSMLAECEVVWDEYPGTVKSYHNTAMAQVEKWMQRAIPTFGSNSERPHQPLRIYRKHLGRCGEFADLRAAAARTALVPCTSVLSMSTDHTWNEFWMKRWVHWDNQMDTPNMYEYNWSPKKVFGSVFQIRSDGHITSVSKTYSSGTSEIIINVLDKNHEPVDNAKVYLVTRRHESEDPNYPEMRLDNYGFTGCDGNVSFIVGDGREYVTRVESEIGNKPVQDSDYLLLLNSSVAGRKYLFKIYLDGEKEKTNYNVQIQGTTERIQHYMTMEYEVEREIGYSASLMGDLKRNPPYELSYYLNSKKWGNMSFLYCNEEDFGSLNSVNMNCSGMWETEKKERLSLAFPDDDQYFVFNNNSLGHFKVMNINMKLYDISENISEEIILYKNYPNPFNSSTRIEYELFNVTDVKMNIYNIIGRKIRTIESGVLNPGIHYFNWDGKNDFGVNLPSGLYFYKIENEKSGKFKKMTLMK